MHTERYHLQKRSNKDDDTHIDLYKELELLKQNTADSFRQLTSVFKSCFDDLKKDSDLQSRSIKKCLRTNLYAHYHPDIIGK